MYFIHHLNIVRNSSA